MHSICVQKNRFNLIPFYDVIYNICILFLKMCIVEMFGERKITHLLPCPSVKCQGGASIPSHHNYVNVDGRTSDRISFRRKFPFSLSTKNVTYHCVVYSLCKQRKKNTVAKNTSRV